MGDSMKGFIFTVDAAFSLVIASAAVGILVYVHLTGYPSFSVTTSQAYSVAQSLIQTNVGQAASGSLYARAAANASLGAQSTWPYFANGGGLSAFSGIGPQLPQLLFRFTANGPISSPISVGYGMAVFGSGNVLYAVNATTGASILQKSISGDVLYPIVYKGYIIYGNSTGYITEVQANGVVTWNSIALPAAPTSPLTLGGGYVVFGAQSNLVFVSPLNGSITYNAMPALTMTPAYGSGEFVASTSSVGSQNYIDGFALVGTSLQQIWSYALTTSITTAPMVSGNLIIVGSGNEIVALNQGGGLRWSATPSGGSVTGGGAVSGGNAYFVVNNNIQKLNFSCGCDAGSFPIPPTYTNTTPSATPSSIYAVTDSIRFVSYLIDDNSTPAWNITVPAASSSPYQDIALAYGNAYLPGGSTLYAFGTCRAPPSYSLLQAIAGMYLQGRGGCAAALLNSSYKSSNVGIFINGTYAPSLHAAYFNGANGIIYAPKLQAVSLSYSVSMWFNTSTGGSTLVDIYNAITNNGIGGGQGANFAAGGTAAPGGHPSYFYWNMSGTSCASPAGSIGSSRWYNVVAVVSNYANTIIYINGNAISSCTASPAQVSIGAPALSIGGYPGQFGNEYMSDLQIYSGDLNASQAQSIYLSGIGGAPLQGNSTTRLLAWYPLNGDANDYSGYSSLGYSYNVIYNAVHFNPVTFSNTYQISAASFLFNLNKNANAIYNVSVVVWR